MEIAIYCKGLYRKTTYRYTELARLWISPEVVSPAQRFERDHNLNLFNLGYVSMCIDIFINNTIAAILKGHVRW